MAKHKVDRAASEGADEAVLNLQQVDALAELKKKIEEGVEESGQAASEGAAEGAVTEEAAAAEGSVEVASADSIVLSSADSALLSGLSADSVFTPESSHSLVAQAGGAAAGAASSLPGWVVPVAAAGVGVAAIVVASDSDDDGDGGGGQVGNPVVQTVTPDVTSVDEGSAVTFSIQTDGTDGIVNFRIEGLQVSDIASVNNASSNVLTGTTAVGSDGVAQVTVVLANDLSTEGAETITLVALGGVDGAEVTSAGVTVNDTSTEDQTGGDPTLEISSNAGDDNAIGEGQSVTFAFDAANLPPGANLSYTLSGDGLNAGDLASVTGQTAPLQLGGFITVNPDGSVNPFTVAIINDGVVGGPENLTITLRLNGTLLAQSTIDINDAGNASTVFNNLGIEAVDLPITDDDALRLTGDIDIRIDFTQDDPQIVGLDINGSGVRNGASGIATDGTENNPNSAAFQAFVDGAQLGGYGVVDAYARNPLNQGDPANPGSRDTVNNFYGDIDFDGTGFGGDGVSTDGNIFLGGLGADTALGGIGNDFLTGGGVGPLAGAGGDTLSGGRNGDFFFGEGSLLSSVDGDALFVNGGSTSDDLAAGNNSRQDSDWFLGEFSDDDEPIVVRLTGQLSTGGTSATTGEDGRILSDNGIDIEIDEIEHYDASGNTYGFLNDLDVIIGGRQAFEDANTPGNENYGIGSSAQHDILGSEANNILIGGFDNDQINGAEGNDLLFGGRFDFLRGNEGFVPNPNLQDIVNNGIDTLIGGDGNDGLVFEADGGTISGDADTRVRTDAAAVTGDTLWVTEYALGRNPDDNSAVVATDEDPDTDDVTTDGVLRFDLQAGDGTSSAVGAGIPGFRGYGGADVGSTVDQTNYSAGGFRVTATGLENVILTGLGGVDYLAGGGNTPELGFNNQQFLDAYEGDADLRGTDDSSENANGSNVLYASSGDDTLEGRGGDDFLSGGRGNDDFIFNLFNNQGAGTLVKGDAGDFGDGGFGAPSNGDNVDVVHRQTDAGFGIWAGFNEGDPQFERDFNAEDGSLTTVTNLAIDFTGTAFENPPLRLASFEVSIGGEMYTADLGNVAFATLQQIADTIADNLVDSAGNADPNVSVRVDGNSIVIEDNPGDGQQGRAFDDSPGEGGDFPGYNVLPTNADNVVLRTFPTANVQRAGDEDRLIYQSYEDRLDGERTNDDTENGSFISLGTDSYAEDLVAFFGEDGTRLAEDQVYTLTFTNLTTQDVVTVRVNGVEYTLTVGQFLDGTPVAAEDLSGTATTQAGIQTAFMGRLVGFINSFSDAHTAAGQIGAFNATTATVDGITTSTFQIAQSQYVGEETVFIRLPEVDVDDNTSGGQIATGTVTNNSEHEVFLLGFDGTNNELRGNDRDDGSPANVLFWGDTEINRAIFETALDAGGALNGSESLIVDSETDNLEDDASAGFEASFDNRDTNAGLDGVNNFSVHGDDLLIGGIGDDVISGFTGDDRILGSQGMDSVNGGIDLFMVRIGTDPLGVNRVIQLNLFEAIAVRDADNVGDIPQQVLDRVPGMSGFVPGSLIPIGQTEDGTSIDALDATENLIAFSDVLQFQQFDFGDGATFTVGVAETDFVLNDDGIFELRQGGAGFVNSFVAGAQVGATAFQEIEAIRTISGTGEANARDGQGNDTLDMSAASNAKSPIPNADLGILYNITSNTYVAAGDTADGGQPDDGSERVLVLDFGDFVGNDPGDIAGAPGDNDILAGQIRYSSDGAADDDSSRPQAGDYEQTYGLKVDGVENFIGGNGRDMVIVDEREANKDNMFTLGGGYDRVVYYNMFMDEVDCGGNDNCLLDEETDFRVLVGPGVEGTHQVLQHDGTTGLLEDEAAVDTLSGVQAITLDGTTAQSIRENDFIDLSGLAGGGVVNFIQGDEEHPYEDQPAYPFFQQSVYDATTGDLLLTIENMDELENVDGSANGDLVIVGDADDMDNATSDTRGETWVVKLPAVGTTFNVAGETFTVELGDDLNDLFNDLADAALASGVDNFDVDFSDVGDCVEITLFNEDGGLNANSVSSSAQGAVMFVEQLSDLFIPVPTWLEFDDEPGTPRILVNNVGQRTFDLMGGSDTVDYSDAEDNISLAVTRGTNVPQFVIVDGVDVNSDDRFDDRDDFASFRGGSDNDRIDQLDSVEQVIASQGESILDLTGLELEAGEQNFQIVYGGINPGLGNAAIDRQGYDVNVNVGQANGASMNVRTFGEFRDLGDASSFTDTPVGDDDIMEIPAAWNSVEGGNNDERVLVGGDGSEAVIARLTEDHFFNLRGSQVTGTIGQGNSVQYGGYDLQAGGVTVNFGVSVGMGGFVGGFDPFDPDADQGESGFVTLSATFSDLDGMALDGTHFIGSYTQDNQDAAGQLLIEAAVSGNDVIGLNNLADGSTIIVGATGVGGSGEIRVIQAGTPDADGNPVDNIVVFTGFEVLRDDGLSDNAYSFANLAVAAATLELQDGVVPNPMAPPPTLPTNDHDAIVVNNTVFNAMGMGFNGAPVDTIDLGLINTAAGLGFNFDFDVLDVTGVTRPNINLIGTSDVNDTTPGDDGEPQNDNLARLPLIMAGDLTNGLTDEAVVGDLSLINDISEFESLVITEATVAGGSSFVLNVDDGLVTQNGTTVTHDGGLLLLSAGGLVLETSLVNGSYVDAVTTDVTLTAMSEATGVGLVGGAGDDTITGGGGMDLLIGGLGADMLDGGVQPKVESYTFDGAGLADDTAVVFEGIELFMVGDAVEGVLVASDDPDAVAAAILRIFNSGSTYTLAPNGVGPVEVDNPFAPGGTFEYIESMTYDALSNELVLTYDPDVGNSFDTTTITGATANPDVPASGNPQLRTEFFTLVALATDVDVVDSANGTTLLFTNGDNVNGTVVDVTDLDSLVAAIFSVFNSGDTYSLNGDATTPNPFADGGPLDYIESLNYNTGNNLLTVVHTLASANTVDITAFADQADAAAPLTVPFDIGVTDNFGYLTAADSTVDSMDVITGFTAAQGGDSINFALIDADDDLAETAGTVATVSINTVDDFDDLADFLDEADDVFNGTILAFVGATAANAANPTAWVALDANADGAFNADDDLVLSLAGLSVEELATFDVTQIVL